MSVQATTVVSFNSGSDAEYVFNLELDESLNLDLEGEVKSSFSPSDIIYLQVNKSDNVDIIDIVVTSGKISINGNDTREATVNNLFVARDETEDTGEFLLPHIASDFSVSFIGKTGAVEDSVTSIGQSKLIPDKTKTPFIAEIKYTYKVTSYKFTAPDIELEENETYETAIVFYINVR